MMLGEGDLVRYLLRQQLVTSKCIVQGDLRIVDVSRRNHNLAVLTGKQSYLLKQARNSACSDSIANEAALYTFFNSESKPPHGLRPYLPQFFGYDHEEHAVFLEFITNARTLREHYHRCGRFSSRLADLIGDALSSLHRISYRSGIDKTNIFCHRKPWIFAIHQPTVQRLRNMTEGHIHIVKILQQHPEYGVLLEQLCAEWEAKSLIHFDLKCDNCLVVVSPRNTTLKIIDWELAGWGDPSWDVGSIFADYLSYWLFSIPVTAETQADQFLQFARYPLEKLQPAIRAFWRSYVLGMQIDVIASNQLLLRAMRYSAARLIQTCYEQMEAASQLAASTVCALQLSINILNRPKDAIPTLLGLSLR
jgi:thiamine kinase-like enzyme